MVMPLALKMILPMICDRPPLLQWELASPQGLSLLPNEIHLWLYYTGLESGSLGPGWSEAWAILSEAEQARAQRLTLPLTQQRFVQTRATLRRLLGHYLDHPPQSLRFVIGPQGKPTLVAADSPGLHFNISHSQDWVVYALAQAPIGVDIEQIRAFPNALALADRFFDASESQTIKSQPPDARDLAFLRHWVCKEAYVKATGQGLAHQLNQIVLTFDPDPGHPATQVQFVQPQSHWTLWEITPLPMLTGAIVWATPAFESRPSSGLAPRIRTLRLNHGMLPPG